MVSLQLQNTNLYEGKCAFFYDSQYLSNESQNRFLAWLAYDVYLSKFRMIFPSGPTFTCGTGEKFSSLSLATESACCDVLTLVNCEDSSDLADSNGLTEIGAAFLMGELEKK